MANHTKAVLELKNISLRLSDQEDAPYLLRDVSVMYPRGHFGAIVGPSGCGKSTLLKSIVGLYEPQDGIAEWNGFNLDDEDLHPTELGYVPQFSIFHENLTVRECVSNAVKLRTHARDRGDAREHIQKVLTDVGLEEIGDRKAKVLSGGQRRRLGLALELVSNPELLLCDEVTSGLDPKSEDDIVQLMRYLSEQDNRIVLSVTHSLRHLDLYDSVTVLYRGFLAYQGHPSFLLSYFGVQSAEDVYPALIQLQPEVWAGYWLENRHQYLGERSEGAEATAVAVEDVAGDATSTPVRKTHKKVPGFLAQFFVQFFRRWKLFFRDMSQVLLQTALVLIFPFLVVIFAFDGLPDIQNMIMDRDANVIEELMDKLKFTLQAFKVGSLVSNLAFLQVVLLTLMASNNSAREVAGERAIWEKEKLAGVSVLSYLASKAAYLFILVLIQAGWMAAFVKHVCDLPGAFADQALLLFLATTAMTTTCLAISSWARTAEQSSLISIYLVGFQVPLSGAILNMPDTLEMLTRPFIAAFWAWSGYVQTLQNTRFYDLVVQVAPTSLVGLEVSHWVLICHILVTLLLAFLGCSKGQWED
ncbi:MAG: ATP-binding cassette domain-containing protein [Verrucomicrobiota bacterium]